MRRLIASKTVSLTKEDKNPKGGLSGAGRKKYNEATGSNLKPGVKKVKTLEDKKRKGSFLTRFFTNPRGPLMKDGEPTRLSLSAAAWGETPPKTVAQAHKLAAKGRKLLEQYRKEKDKKKK